jgi:hypothetical protein
MDCVWPSERPPYREPDGRIVVCRVAMRDGELVPNGYEVLAPGDEAFQAWDGFLRSHGR